MYPKVPSSGGHVLPLGEGEVRLGVVGAHPPAFHHCKAESEPAEEHEHGGQKALTARLLAAEDKRQGREDATEDRTPEEKRRELLRAQGLAPPAHLYQGRGHQPGLYEEDEPLGPMEGLKGALLPPPAEVQDER